MIVNNSQLILQSSKAKASYLGDIGIENIELVCYKGPTKIFNIQLSFDLFMLYGFNYLCLKAILVNRAKKANKSRYLDTVPKSKFVKNN